MLIEKGKAYLFHTPLGVWLGKVVAIEPEEVMLNTCSWVASQGRLSVHVETGSYEELEYVGDGVIVPRGGITIPWRHKLPKETK